MKGRYKNIETEEEIEVIQLYPYDKTILTRDGRLIDICELDTKYIKI